MSHQWMLLSNVSSVKIEPQESYCENPEGDPFSIFRTLCEWLRILYQSEVTHMSHKTANTMLSNYN